MAPKSKDGKVRLIGETETEKAAAKERDKFALVGRRIRAQDILAESGFGMFADNPFDAERNRDPKRRFKHVFDCFDKMADWDEQINAADDVRRLSVLSFERGIIPRDEKNQADVKAAAIANENIERLGQNKWDEALLNALDAPAKGLAFLQKEFILDGGIVYLSAFDWLPQEWFNFTAQNELVFTGGRAERKDPVLPARIATGTVRATVKNPWGYGYLRAAYWPFLIKNILRGYSTDLFEMFIEPMRIGKYANPAHKRLLDDVLKKMGRHFGVSIPAECSIDVIEQKGTAAYTSLQKFVDYWDEQQLRVILGQPMTMGGGGDERGTLGRATIAQFQQTTKCIRDAKYLDALITGQVLDQLSYQNTVGGRCIHKTNYERNEDADTLLDRAIKMAKELGVGIGAEWLHKITQVPAPPEDGVIYLASKKTPEPFPFL